MRRVLMMLGLTLLTASVLPCLSNPALAQIATPGLSLGAEKEISEEDKARAKAREDAARAASDRIPIQQKASNDPWAGARDVTPPPASPAMQINPKQKQKKK
jgi:glycine/D-amino acid oxidase-like deaminating enzyme